MVPLSFSHLNGKDVMEMQRLHTSNLHIHNRRVNDKVNDKSFGFVRQTREEPEYCFCAVMSSIVK